MRTSKIIAKYNNPVVYYMYMVRADIQTREDHTSRVIRIDDKQNLLAKHVKICANTNRGDPIFFFGKKPLETYQLPNLPTPSI